MRVFTGITYDLSDSYVPLTKVARGLNDTRTWLNDQIHQAIVERDIAFRKWNLFQYRKIRNKVNRLIKDAKQNYFDPRLKSFLCSKLLWKNICAIGLDRFVSDCSTPNVEFWVLCHLLRFCPRTSQLDQLRIYEWFLAHGSSSLDIALPIGQVRSDAVSLDIFSIKFIRLVLPVIMPVITHIAINDCIMTSRYLAAGNWLRSFQRTKVRKEREWKTIDLAHTI